MGTTYWRTVVLYRDLFPGRPCPSSQFLHRFAKRVGIQELKDLQAQFKKRLSPFLPKGESALLSLDSTGCLVDPRARSSGGGGEGKCRSCGGTVAFAA